MCLFREFHLQGLHSPKMRSLPGVNEQSSDKRNAANGTLWTDTNYICITSPYAAAAASIMASDMVGCGCTALMIS